MNSTKSVLSREAYDDVMDWHRFLAQRNIVDRQGVVTSRVKVVVQMDDETLLLFFSALAFSCLAFIKAKKTFLLATLIVTMLLILIQILNGQSA